MTSVPSSSPVDQKNMTTANVSSYNDVYIPHSEFIDLHKAKYMAEILKAKVAIALDTSDIKILQAVEVEGEEVASQEVA